MYRLEVARGAVVSELADAVTLYHVVLYYIIIYYYMLHYTILYYIILYIIYRLEVARRRSQRARRHVTIYGNIIQYNII
jgi:hypothetical protein